MLSLVSSAVVAQKTCPGAGAQYEPTIVANGFSTYVLAKGLSSPRGIVFDKEGNLLVLEQFKGVTALRLNEENGCVTVASKHVAMGDLSVSMNSYRIFSNGLIQVGEPWYSIISRWQPAFRIQC